jgi:hypothetical protein
MRVEVSEVTQLCGRATFPEILLSAASRVLPTDGSAFVRVLQSIWEAPAQKHLFLSAGAWKVLFNSGTNADPLCKRYTKKKTFI